MSSKDQEPKKPVLQDILDEGSVDPVYHAKARILNEALQEIGMGRYQRYLFIVAGFGWFADSVWPFITGLILNPVILEFQFNSPYLSLAANIGLLVGAIFWSFTTDIWGRRWNFNLTLLLAGIFGIAAGGSNSFVTLASLIAIVGAGVGGNIPIDTAVFLDIVPGTHQYLLTVMSVFWSLGQVFVSMIAWPLISNFTCSAKESCTKSENMGWRYLLFTLGGVTLILWGIRFFLFDLLESPRFLVGIGNDEAAVNVINKVAQYNRSEVVLTVNELNKAGDAAGDGTQRRRDFLSKSSAFGLQNVTALFSTPKMAFSTSLLMFIWGIIGLGSTLYNSFLPYFLSTRGAAYGDGSLYITYRNQAILSAIGVPGAFIAGYAVQLPYIGRRGTLALSCGLTGAFLYATTTARTSNALLGWNCGYVMFSDILYGVLYSFSSEIFPGQLRGTGNGLVHGTNRIFGVIAPVIALYADLSTPVPVYVSGALVIFAGLLVFLLPYEPLGRASI